MILKDRALIAHGIETVPRLHDRKWYEPVGPTDYGKGRRCRVCRAFVCRYNGEDTCWHHGLHELDVDLLGEALEEMAA